MFDWFKNLVKPKKETYPTWADIPPPDNLETNMDNVVQLPTPKNTPPMPEVKPAVDYGICHYTVGSTTTNYVNLKVQDANGYGSTLSMNNAAVRHLIKQLEAAMVEDETNDQDGNA
jgi:hypothetical protein